VGSIDRARDRATRRATRALHDLGEELRHARFERGVSQQAVAFAAGVDRADYSRLEAGKLPGLSIVRAYRVAAALGLDLSLRTYPVGAGIRDAGQAKRLQRPTACVGPPLTWRAEVPFPRTDDRVELRSRDLVLFGQGERTAIELETRLYDLQAQLRRFALKQRDDPVEHFLLVVADTRRNRRVLFGFADLLGDLTRLRAASVLSMLRAGRHPPTGIILV
jgi:transcriptional regulator with XRE-family HTH domain